MINPTSLFLRAGVTLLLALSSLGAGALETPVPKKPSPDFSPVIDLIDGWVKKGYYNGASIRVVQNNRLVLEHSFGKHSPDTVEFIASAGKWLAAATILAVAEEGKLSLNDPVSKWLPELGEAKGKATLRQLLSHTSGYPAYQPEGSPPDNYQTLAESVKAIVPLALDSDPGTKWNYGGLAMQVAGRMAEVASGKDFETLFQDKIAGLLSMSSTRFTPVDKGFGHTPMLGGGARSTLNDYTRFLLMLASEGTFDFRRLLSLDSIKELESDQVKAATFDPNNFVTKVRGSPHHGIYGLGQWREIENAAGAVVLSSSPSWAGTYPWIDKRQNTIGIFMGHVITEAAAKDKFNAMEASAELPVLIAKALEAPAKE